MAKAYEVTIQGTYRNQLIINRLSFASDIDDPSVVGAFQLAVALGVDPMTATAPTVDSVLDYLLQAQTAYYQIDKLFLRNLESATDFYQFVVTGVGWQGQIAASSAGSSSSFVSQKLVTNRVRTDVRPGTLALTPPSEGNYDVDGVLTSGQVGVLQDLCTALNAPPSYTAGPTTAQFFPSVFKKEEYVPDPLKPDKTAYRYPEDIQVMLTNSAIGVTWSPVERVTTQTSRRIGKGR